MAAEYAKDKPQGFKNHVEKVAIVGVGGQVGKFIVEELLKTGKHQVTAITRAESTSKVPDGVAIKKVNYDDPTSLEEALRGQEALIITMGVTAPPDQQTKLINAAAAAGVSWILPNEFGTDGSDTDLGHDIMIGDAKRPYRAQIEKLGKSWIGICCSFWYEYSLGGGTERYGFNFKDRSVLFFDDGNKRIDHSTWPQTGRGVARLLSLKVLPDDEEDKSVCLSNYRNDFVYVSSFYLNQKEMFDVVLRVTGTKPEQWKISHRPSSELYKEGVEQLKAGDRIGFVKLLYSRVFYPDGSGSFPKQDNEALDLPKEDLDEFTKLAAKMGEEYYSK